MKHYYGTKELEARPMTRGEYNRYRGWEMPSDEDATETGYLVEYVDGGGANHPDHMHYISWSPGDVFEATYKPTNAMSFGHALVALKKGLYVARSGWNGKGMFIFLTEVHDSTNYKIPGTSNFDGEFVSVNSHIDMKAADGSYVTGWLASQADMLADDWCIVN